MNLFPAPALGDDRNFVVPVPDLPTIPVVGSDARFPVRRIWCVGRNYAEHAREMNADPVREPPFFFAKPADAIVAGGGSIDYPTGTANLHHEVELAVAMRSGGRDIPVDAAMAHVFGYAIALDMTRRDLQDQAKQMKRPWDMAKGFDQSCPIGAIRPASQVASLSGARLSLSVNGHLRQQGLIDDMIWSVAECIAALSALVEIRAGDLLLTGTPAGVGAVGPDDVIVAQCDHVGELQLVYRTSVET